MAVHESIWKLVVLHYKHLLHTADHSQLYNKSHLNPVTSLQVFNNDFFFLNLDLMGNKHSAQLSDYVQNEGT